MNGLENKFEKIGARLKLKSDTPQASRRNEMASAGLRLNVLKDKLGEFFDIQFTSGDKPEVSVLDLQPEDRHLLLLVRGQRTKSKFLCGHDERHWFVAAIPELAPVGTVLQAKEALKPKEIQIKQNRVGVKGNKRNKRKNEVFKRQGEWFFVPDSINLSADWVLKNEPITRGRGSKPHKCEFLVRKGGETVFVCGNYPNGITRMEYNRLLKTNPNAKEWAWRSMVKDAAVYVRGRISHPDHKTIVLSGWHRVLMNTEAKAKAMAQVAFLD